MNENTPETPVTQEPAENTGDLSQKHPGRPSDYSEEMVKKAEEYLKSCVDEIAETKTYVNIPSVAGLAVYLGVARSTVYEWAKLFSQFSDILERILAEQERRLTSNGLSGAYNSTITKLMLTKHGYTDKTENETNLNAKVDATITGMKIINDGTGVQDQKQEADRSSTVLDR